MTLRQRFPPPSDPALLPAWDALMDASAAFIATIQRHVPPGKNKDEALDRAMKAVMVATGAFATRRG